MALSQMSSSSLTVRVRAIDTADNVGGLVGNFGSGTITNSNSSGSVSASGGADIGWRISRIASYR